MICDSHDDSLFISSTYSEMEEFNEKLDLFLKNDEELYFKVSMDVTMTDEEVVDKYIYVCNPSKPRSYFLKCRKKNKPHRLSFIKFQKKGEAVVFEEKDDCLVFSGGSKALQEIAQHLKFDWGDDILKSDSCLQVKYLENHDFPDVFSAKGKFFNVTCINVHTARHFLMGGLPTEK